jgi:ABC-type branched-subunit amino acid transport system ATPase component
LCLSSGQIGANGIHLPSLASIPLVMIAAAILGVLVGWPSRRHQSGTAVLMVEQNASMALSIADRGYVLSTGEIVLEGSAAELLSSEDLKRAYRGR